MISAKVKQVFSNVSAYPAQDGEQGGGPGFTDANLGRKRTVFEFVKRLLSRLKVRAEMRAEIIGKRLPNQPFQLDNGIQDLQVVKGFVIPGTESGPRYKSMAQRCNWSLFAII
jgi:hypothetical protein